MGLDAGKDETQLSGMSQAIYEQLFRMMSPPLKEAVDGASDDPKAKEAAQTALKAADQGWQQLAFAVAKGVISHIQANMEIKGIQTRGDVSASGSSTSGPAPPAAHVHSVSLTATQSGVTFTQSNDGPGHVA
jgi:hypothetical protein